MNLTAEMIVALAGVFGTLMTGLVTYLATRSTIRNSQRQLDLDERKSDVSVSVDAAEKIGNLSLAMATNVQAQLSDCVTQREKYRLEAEAYRLLVANIKVRLNKVVIRLQNMHDKHSALSEEYNMQSCPGYPALQDMITSAIDDIQAEIKNGNPY
jgi:F0F1-type ATP synthase membrane subunit b/b'